MKKIFGFVLAIIALSSLSGCDDGEMSFKTFDFDNDQNPTACGDDVLYKIVGTEVLILQFDRNTLLPNVETNGTPRVVTFSGTTNTITYRNYNADVTNDVVCTEFAPSTPVVIDQWEGQGTISVLTTRITTGGVVSFQHTIRLTDVTFTKDGEEIRIQDNAFGSVTTTRGFDFDFEDEDTGNPVQTQNCDGRVFTAKADEALVLEFPEEAFSTTVGTATINIEDNLDIYDINLRVFSGTIANPNNPQNTRICNPSIDAPEQTQRWQAQDGTIRIVTTLSGGFYNYDIYLIDAIFYNQATGSVENFQPDDNTTEPGVYYFGQYSVAQ